MSERAKSRLEGVWDPEPLERDPEVRELLAAAGAEPRMDDAEWGELRRRIGAGAAPALAERRARIRRTRTVLGGLALAASVAALLFLPSAPRVPAGAGSPAEPLAGTPSGARPEGEPELAVGGLTVDELFDADMTDEEFRTLLEGGPNVDALLMIAAEEGEL